MPRKRKTIKAKSGITKTTVYRDPKTGRFAKKTTGKKLKRERYEFRRAVSGRLTAGIKVSGEKIIMKTVTSEVLNKYQGMISTALGSTNVFTSLRKAKFVEIRVSAKDKRHKIYRFAADRDISEVNNKSGLVQDVILEMLRNNGLRTNYSIDVVDWSRAEISPAMVQRMRVLPEMEIVVKIRK